MLVNIQNISYIIYKSYIINLSIKYKYTYTFSQLKHRYLKDFLHKYTTNFFMSLIKRSKRTKKYGNI